MREEALTFATSGDVTRIYCTNQLPAGNVAKHYSLVFVIYHPVDRKVVQVAEIPVVAV